MKIAIKYYGIAQTIVLASKMDYVIDFLENANVLSPIQVKIAALFKVVKIKIKISKIYLIIFNIKYFFNNNVI